MFVRRGTIALALGTELIRSFKNELVCSRCTGEFNCRIVFKEFLPVDSNFGASASDE